MWGTPLLPPRSVSPPPGLKPVIHDADGAKVSLWNENEDRKDTDPLTARLLDGGTVFPESGTRPREILE